jgi:hypothetical protein
MCQATYIERCLSEFQICHVLQLLKTSPRRGLYFEGDLSGSEATLCRVQQEGIAMEFLEQMTPDLAAATCLRDVVPLLQPLGLYEGIVNLSIAKADAQVRS